MLGGAASAAQRGHISVHILHLMSMEVRIFIMLVVLLALDLLQVLWIKVSKSLRLQEITKGISGSSISVDRFETEGGKLSARIQAIHSDGSSPIDTNK